MTIVASNLGSPRNEQTSSRDISHFVKATPKQYNQRSSIQHWQLRDLIHCPIDKTQFYHVHQNNVYSTNVRTKQNIAVLKDLTFAPTSMTTGCGYLATGGQRSQLMVRQINSNWFAQTTVGGSINNSLCISAHPRTTDSHHAGDIRLLVCNNDETIKVFSLPSLQRVTTIGLPTAVNYASVSPDGRKMVAVGDSNQVFVFDITASGYYQRIGTLEGSKDAGFSCSWNYSSDKFAVASQDGVVSVWDIRKIPFSSDSSSGSAALSFSGNTQKLAYITSTQHPQVKGAVRTVKFSPSSSVDLLIFSEHVSYLNFIDARTFDMSQRQSIRVGSFQEDSHISGACFSPDSRSVFLGLETSVLEFDVDTVARRSFPSGVLI